MLNSISKIMVLIAAIYTSSIEVNASASPFQSPSYKLVKASNSNKSEIQAFLSNTSEVTANDIAEFDAHASPPATIATAMVASMVDTYLIKNNSNAIMGIISVQHENHFPSGSNEDKIKKIIQKSMNLDTFNDNVGNISIIIGKTARGHGLATKACSESMAKFKNDYSVIVWITKNNNAASIATAKACGFSIKDEAKIKTDETVLVKKL